MTRNRLAHFRSFAVLALLATPALVTAAACGDDSDASGAPSGGEGGLIDSYLADGALIDLSVTPAAPNARLVFVNAAHDLGPQASLGGSGNATLRLCFGTGPTESEMTVPPVTPEPDFQMTSSATAFPGVDQGRGVVLPDIAIPFAERVLWPIVISSRAIESSGTEEDGTALSCDRLVGPTRLDFQLTENVDYWVLTPLAPATLLSGHSYILALTGCAIDATTENPGKCGPGFVTGEASNLALRVFEIGPAPTAGVRFLHLSSAVNAYFTAENARDRIQPGFYPGVSLTAPDPPLYSFSPPVQTSLGESIQLSPSFINGNLVSNSLDEVASASGLTAYSGDRFVFALVGDADKAETAPQTTLPLDGGSTTIGSNPRYVHFLGFPTGL